MLSVDDIYDEGKKIFGSCNDTTFFRWVTDAVKLIANKSDFEGWKGWLDICTADTDGRCVTLPREVGTVLAVNLDGQPTLGMDQLFQFHLNGPGSCQGSCMFSWTDQGRWHPVYKDLVTPAKIVAYTELSEDDGSELIVFGFDQENKPLRRHEGGEWLNGYRVPTIHGYAVPDDEAPVVARITHVQKDVTAGTLRLATIDSSGPLGVNLAVYEPDETLPQYRRIRLGRSASWVRIAYRKSYTKITSRYDHLPLNNRLAFLLALRACKFYNEQDLANAHAYEADAARLELEEQSTLEPPTLAPIQVVDLNQPRDKSDYFNIS